jgi:antitoxin FitA-like protein
MQTACYYAEHMRAKKTDVQIRGVPVALRERLRKRADSKGLSMSQYVIEILTDDLVRPTLAEWLAEVGKSPPINLGGKTGADLVREGRRELGIED